MYPQLCTIEEWMTQLSGVVTLQRTIYVQAGTRTMPDYGPPRAKRLYTRNGLRILWFAAADALDHLSVTAKDSAVRVLSSTAKRGRST